MFQKRNKPEQPKKLDLWIFQIKGHLGRLSLPRVQIQIEQIMPRYQVFLSGHFQLLFVHNNYVLVKGMLWNGANSKGYFQLRWAMASGIFSGTATINTEKNLRSFLLPEGNKIRLMKDSGAHAGRRDKQGIEFSHQYLWSIPHKKIEPYQ